MKIIIILSIGIIACFSSCNEKPNSRNINISFLEAETNYFPSDSLQQLAGYYPVRVYLFLAVYNTSRDTLFLPLNNRHNRLMNSMFEFAEDIYGEPHSWEYGVLLPKDTTNMVLIVDLDDIPIFEIISTLHNFIKDIEINYKAVKSDTLLSKYPMPDSVIFDIDRNIRLKFLDVEDLGVESDWIL